MMLFTPLLLQTRGISRKITTFLLHFMYLLVSVVLKLDHNEQRQLADGLGKLPRTADYLYSILKVDMPSNAYICCPQCFALYDAETLHPIKRDADLYPRGKVPPAPPPPLIQNQGEDLNYLLYSYLIYGQTLKNQISSPKLSRTI
jgi:hypothetical protein